MKQDKKLKWETPELVKLSKSKATGGEAICQDGYTNINGCDAGRGYIDNAQP